MALTILVTGAAGFIGKRFCSDAIGAGHHVVALVRPGRKDGLPPGRVVYGTLPYDIPERAWDGVDAVVHCAAITTGHAAGESEAVNLDGTRYLAQQAAKHSVKRFVFLSTQSAHEHAVTPYGITKRKAEDVVRKSGIGYAILRPGLVYGSGQNGLFYRMRRTVSRLPFLPLLGGGKAPVQAIEVGDLSNAMLACVDLPPDENVELFLGDPDAIPLYEFLQRISLTETGRRKMQISIPLAPLGLVVSIAEKLHLPFPISSDNLRGLRVVQTMQTAESLKRIGLVLKPLDEGLKLAMQDAKAESSTSASAADPQVRVLQIGAGKIGIVHALNLRQRENAKLCAITDPNAKAFGLYKSMGFKAAFESDVEEAIAKHKPHAVIIAAPASTHLPLTQMCMERGLPVLVEKPLCIKRSDTEEYLKLAGNFPDAICHAGYMAAQFPHLEKARALLAGGSLGEVVTFQVFGLQSHIMAATPVRWEMLKAKSGGGVLINFAGHVISMLFRLWGPPAASRGCMWPIYSTEVEDAAYVTFDYGTFRGELITSWSIDNYPRPENRIVIECSNGRLELDNYAVSVSRDGKTTDIWTQQDFDVGYNASPDYTGAEFSAEHINFLRAVQLSRNGRQATTGGGLLHADNLSNTPVGIREAIQLEQWIFSFYERTPLELPHSTTGQNEGSETADRMQRLKRQLMHQGQEFATKLKDSRASG